MIKEDRIDERVKKSNTSDDAVKAANELTIKAVEEFFEMNDFPEVIATLNQLMCHSIAPRQGCVTDINLLDTNILNTTQTINFLAGLYKLHRDKSA